MAVLTPRNSPHDLVENCIPEISGLGFSCVRLCRVVIRLGEVNFYKIRLQVSCLDSFEYIISPQKRVIIHHLCLDVVLPRYTSICCSKRSSPSVKISSVVSDGIWKLFSILSTWKFTDNLALEINVYSPSDCEHWFKNLHLSFVGTLCWMRGGI